MNTSPLPLSVDLRTAAQQGEVLRGSCPLTALERLCSDWPADDAALNNPVVWEATPVWREPLPGAGVVQARVAGGAQLWLHLTVQAQVPQVCQRCLTPALEAVEVDRWFRFVADEATAAAEDDDSDEDLLVLEPRFNLLALIEDELLMGLPLVPMHAVCPVAVQLSAGDIDAPAAEAERPHPFAALAALKGGAKSSQNGA